MNFLKNVYRTYFEEGRGIGWIYLLLALTVMSHWQWLDPFATFTHTDWVAWSTQAAKEAWSSQGAWINSFNLGAPNVQINFYGCTVIWSLIANLGFSLDLAIWLTYLLPILLMSFLSPYALARKLIKNNLIAFAVAMFYGTVIYFLARQDSQLPMVLIFSLTPIVLLRLIRATETNRFKDWLIFALLLWLSSLYELRVTTIAVVILTIFFLGLHITELKKYVKNICIVGIIFVGLSLFWLLPTVLGGISSNVSSIADTGVWGSQLFDLKHALTISDSSWTGGIPNEVFVSQAVKWWLWLLPVLAFSAPLFSNYFGKKEKRHIACFLVISLLGIFLTKESAPPFGSVYAYLYSHLPGFNFYREASKFYLITGIGYLGLIGYTLLGLSRHLRAGGTTRKLLYYGAIVAISLIAVVNLKPFVFEDFNGMIKSRTIPASYATINNFVNAQPGYFRTFWLPTAAPWGTYSNAHPKVSAVDMVGSGNPWNDYLTPSETKLPNYQAVTTFLKDPEASSLLDAMSVKYVIVPLRDTANQDDQFPWYGNNRQYFTDTLGSLPWLKQLNLNTPGVAVYQNLGYEPYVQALTQIATVPSYDNAANEYKFFALELPDIKNTIQNSSDIVGTTTVDDLFNNISRSNLSDGKVTATIRTQSGSAIKINTNKPTIDYQVANNQITLTSQNEANLLMNGVPLSNTSQTSTIGGVTINPNNTYYIGKGSSLIPVDTKQAADYSLGVDPGNVSIYTPVAKNSIANPTFTNGTWKVGLQNCDNYGPGGDIHMNLLSLGGLSGQSALQLIASNQTACTGQDNIPVKAGQPYIFSFDFALQNSDKIGYTITFNDKAHTTINVSELPETDVDEWRGFSREVTVPNGATTLSFRVMGYQSDNLAQPTAVTEYKSFDLQQLSDVFQPTIDQTPHYVTVPLSETKSAKFTYSVTGFTFDNLIKNPNLTDGLWEKKVGDCDNFNDEPEISMSLDKASKSTGTQSLQLGAQSHIACTGPPSIAVSQGNDYYLQFDYESPDSGPAGYSVVFNDPAHTQISNLLPVTNSKWHTASIVMQAPIGATTASITVYAYPNSNIDSYIYDRYDNFYFTAIPAVQDQYYYVSSPHSDLKKPAALHVNQVNPTDKIIRITGATTPFYVTTSEAYDTGWHLILHNKGITESISSINHYDLNGFMNGWYVNTKQLCSVKGACTVNKNGGYNFELIASFAPEHYFDIGLIVSTAVLLVAVGLLFVRQGHRRPLNREIKHDKAN